MQAGRRPTERKPTGADWERVKREAAKDMPIPFDPVTDAISGLHNPNDGGDAVAACWNGATVKRAVQPWPRNVRR